MKKYLSFAMAAIVALAACTKTEVIRTKGQSEIGFKSYVGVATKAPVAAFSDDMKMGVFAYFAQVTSAATVQTYFENANFEKSGMTWHGNPAKYYPTTGYLDFVAYSPINAGRIVPTHSDHLNYSYQLKNNAVNQDDFLVSKYLLEKQEGSTHAMNFHHALALIDLNFKCTEPDLITVTSVEITNVHHNGVATVVYTRTDGAVPTITWEAEDSNKEDDILKYELALTQDFEDYQDTTLGADLLVVPTQTTDKVLTVNYKMKGDDKNTITVTHSLNLGESGKWSPGNRYIYNITMSVTEITLEPKVVAWTESTETLEY